MAESLREISRVLLRELNERMRSPRGDYYQGDINDTHLSRSIVERHIALAIANERQRAERAEEALVDVANRYVPTDQCIDVPVLLNHAALRIAERERELEALRRAGVRGATAMNAEDISWHRDPEGTAEDHWIDLWDGDEAGQAWWYASVKWDGCIHLYHAGNVPFSRVDGWGGPWGGKRERDPQAADDYLHICDLDDLIARLRALREAAIRHFGDWPR